MREAPMSQICRTIRGSARRTASPTSRRSHVRSEYGFSCEEERAGGCSSTIGCLLCAAEVHLKPSRLSLLLTPAACRVPLEVAVQMAPVLSGVSTCCALSYLARFDVCARHGHSG